MTKNKCNIPGCERTNIAAHGVCHTHYARMRRHGTYDDPYYQKEHECMIKGCTDPAKARNMCHKHHFRWLKFQDPHEVLRPNSYDGTICLLKGCHERPRSEGLCHKHYHNYLYHKRVGNLENIVEYVTYKEAKHE